MDFLAVISGFGVGAIVGLTGVGGGSLMTPLLIGVFKLNPALAIGTDLWFAAITKSAGAVSHQRLGHVERGITLRLLAGSLPAAIVTLALMHHLHWAQSGWHIMSLVLGVALLLTALSVAYRQAWQALGLRLEGWLPARHKPALTVAAGVLLGVLVSLTSIGAGAIGATLLLLLYPRLSAHKIVGTDIAHAVPLTLVAGIGHAALGHVDWALLLALLAGSLPGIWVGAKLTRALPEQWVRSLLCLSLIGAGLKLLA